MAAIAFPSVIGILGAPLAHGQSSVIRPEFEVASIKPNFSGERGQTLGQVSPGTFTAINVPVRGLILRAYGLRDNQLVGGPSWLDSDPYDINAKPSDREEAGKTPAQLAEEMWLMLQALLENRFKLKVHSDSRELPVYVLNIAKSGLKARQASCVVSDPKNRDTPPPPGKDFCTGFRGVQPKGRNRTLVSTWMTIKDLTMVLGNLTRRQVIDQTGLTGLFEIHLDWTVETPVPALAETQKLEPARPAVASDPEGPDLLTSLQEQLGLRLESKNAPVRVLVIDYIERPDAN